MTDQEYKQYLIENCSEEEARLYEDVYNEGAIWNGIKAVGKALFNQPNGSFGQNVVNNFNQNQIGSNTTQTKLDTQLGKSKEKTSNIDTTYDNSLKQFALDIASVQSNGLFGKGSKLQKDANKSVSNENVFNFWMKNFKSHYTGDNQSFMQAAQQAVKAGDNADMDIIAKKFKLSPKKENISNNVNRFFEDLNQESEIAKLLQKWGVAANTNGNIDANAIYQYLKGLSLKQIESFSAAFYQRLQNNKKAVANYNTLQNAITNKKTISKNAAIQQKMLAKN